MVLTKDDSILRVSNIPENQIVFYDIETDSVYAPYAKLKMIGYQLGLESEPTLVEPGDEEHKQYFRNLLLDKNIIKVSYNGINYDDIVLWRYDFFVEPRNRFDMYLALKTVAPTLPSFGLSFANWYYFADWHEPERQLHNWCNKKNKEMFEAPKDILGKYCKHDVTQTANIFRTIWEVVQRPLHWNAYRKLELAMAEPLHEMILLGGEWLDPDDIAKQIVDLFAERERYSKIASEKYGIANLGSGQEVTTLLHDEYGVEFDISEAGHFIGRKADWLHLMEPEKNKVSNEVRNIDKHVSLTSHRPQRGYMGTGGVSGMALDAYDPDNVDVSKDPEKHEKQVAKLKYEYQRITKVIGYLRSYLNAARYELERKSIGRNGVNSQGKNGKVCISDSTIGFQERRNRPTIRYSKSAEGDHKIKLVRIPKSYSLSGARTRRFLSGSRFGINFQNQNKRSKVVQLVPPGWLGCWIDSTQIENVVHIWASADDRRRADYEANVVWNEYVWLCNEIQGGNRSREELDKIDSPVNPDWSVYKQFKTCKLALNFGMGIPLFAKTTGITQKNAGKLFDQIHKACPAIKRLQNLVREQIVEDGFIQDPFGHIYSGRSKEAYKVVSYLVQGCGTGSVPKAMTIANYETLHSLDSVAPLYRHFVKHPFRSIYSYGVLTGTTHDECAFRISLDLPTNEIVRLIRECLYNMEEKFSDKFNGIPLRAKLSVSITNAAEAVELNHRSKTFEAELVEQYIKPGKAKLYDDIRMHSAVRGS